MLESKEQTKIKKHLIKDGWLVIKTIQLSDSGYPDIFAFRNSVTLFVEVKREKGGIVSPIQQYRIDMLRNSGFTVFISRGYNNFKEQYESTRF